MSEQEREDATLVRNLIADVRMVYAGPWSNHSVFDLAMRCIRAGRAQAKADKVDPRDLDRFDGKE